MASHLWHDPRGQVPTGTVEARRIPIDRAPFSTVQTAAAVTIAAVASCVPPLQPILLGSLLTEGKIDAATLGRAATAEGLGMAVAAAVASAVLPPRYIRLTAAIAVLSVMAANMMTMLMPAPWIIGARCLSGLGNAVLLWVLVGMLARCTAPTRLFAIYVTASTTLTFLLSLVLTASSVMSFGKMAGYGILICIYLPLFLVIRCIPRSYANIGGSDVRSGLPPRFGLVALSAVVLYPAGVMAFWIYSVPLGVQMGIANPSMQRIVSAATGVQIVGGLVAVAVASRVTGIQAVAVTATVGIASIFATMIDASVAVWLPALLAFSFCWMFGPPFHVAFLNAADPSRRSAMFVGTAQLIGYALGPLLASTAITSSNYEAARLVSLLCFAWVLAIAMLVGFRSGVATTGDTPDIG